MGDQKLQRDVVVYFGMGFLPDQNAVACREQAVSVIAREAGYTSVLIGISKSVPFGRFEKSVEDGVTCYSIKYAASLQDKFKDTYVIKKTLVSVFEDVGVDRIKCFIMQDYQLRPMKQMKKYCHAHGIAFVPDIMDWFTPTKDYSLPKNLFKTVDTILRMRLFYPFLKNKIYISHTFAQHFQDDARKNILVLPCTCKDVERQAVYDDGPDRNVTITFAGFIGKKFEKEKLDWIIQALYENNSGIELNIIGLDKDSIASRDPLLAARTTETTRFWGYLPRQQCLEILTRSDFSIVARKVNKLTQYGFSSKICEAFAHGIPVIATNNSDNKVYIKDGINGYVCDANYESLKELLKKADGLDRAAIREMRRNLARDNPLSVKNYVDGFKHFVENLIV